MQNLISALKIEVSNKLILISFDENNMSKTENCFSFFILFHNIQLIKFICNLHSHNIIVAYIITDNNQKMSLQILFIYNFLYNLFQILIIIIIKYEFKFNKFFLIISVLVDIIAVHFKKQ